MLKVNNQEIITNTLNNDLAFLQASKLKNYQNISIDKIEELIKNKAEVKKNLSTQEEKELYASLKNHLKEVRQFKLPYRVILTAKKYLMQNQKVPSELSYLKLPHPSSTTAEKKEALKKIQSLLIDQSTHFEESLKIVEPIHWIHGTNSAILPMLDHTNGAMHATGVLLNKGLAPMGGELYRSGMCTIGVNQKWISVETIRNLPRALQYATHISNSFNPSIYQDNEGYFMDRLERLETLFIKDDMWDTTIIELLRLKQWKPDLFATFQEIHSERINQLIGAVGSRLYPIESMLLDVLKAPKEELSHWTDSEETIKAVEEKYPTLKDYVSCFRKYNLSEFKNAKYDDYNFLKCKGYVWILAAVRDWRLHGEERMKELSENSRASLGKLFGKEPTLDLILQKLVREKIETRIRAEGSEPVNRAVRLKTVFEQIPTIRFSDKEKEMITNPFPILIASTKSKCYFLNGETEASLISAKWGEDVDLIFVHDKNISEMKDWLEKQGLQEKIRLQPLFMLDPLISSTLYHTSTDVIGENLALTETDYSFINTELKTLLELYLPTKEHHGVAHATRTALFSAVIMEMYQGQGRYPATKPQYIPLTGFLHDVGRKNDFGEDLWDRESGRVCKESMEKLDLTPPEVDILSKSISEKDHESPVSLEQKIIHDADCMEYFRCLLTQPNSFEPERLWLLKDNLPKQLIDLFVEEAKSFIALTERPVIKKHLQGSSDPLRFLTQILKSAKCYPFLSAHLREAFPLSAPQPSIFYLKKSKNPY